MSLWLGDDGRSGVSSTVKALCKTVCWREGWGNVVIANDESDNYGCFRAVFRHPVTLKVDDEVREWGRTWQNWNKVGIPDVAYAFVGENTVAVFGDEIVAEILYVLTGGLALRNNLNDHNIGLRAVTQATQILVCLLHTNSASNLKFGLKKVLPVVRFAEVCTGDVFG